MLVILACSLIFLPSLFNFFSADDWFHLRVSEVSHISQFLNFFSFVRTPQSIAFYRPIPTQVFFFVFQKAFGLNSLPYHLFVLVCFGYSLFLINQLAVFLLNSPKKALLAVLIYGFSVSNFTRLYFLSAFQEIVLVLFSVACILAFIKQKYVFSYLFFILALLSKETAVVLPLILVILDWSRKKINLKKLIPYAFILIPYLYLRLFQFGGTFGETYVWDFSLAKTANTLMWYFLWSLGAPELLVDYIGHGLIPISRFYTDFPLWWPFLLGLLLTNIGILIYFFLRKVKKLDRLLIGFGILFVISLLPVLFLPQHKFALELGLPLVWFSLGVSSLLLDKRKLIYFFLFFYLTLNLSMNYLTYTTHYSIGRGKISQNVFKHFTQAYPERPTGSYFEFTNDTFDYGPSWGSSKQIANSIGDSELFRVLYHDSIYNVYYEDFPGDRPPNEKKIPISTKIFLQ